MADKQNNKRKSPKKKRTGWRRLLFPLMAIMLGLIPLVILELLLVVIGVGKPQSIDDPFVGFSKAYSLFELDAEASKYETSHAKRLFFGIQSFAKKKPDDGFRVFCLGGSTVRGRPYENDSAFTKWLELELAAGDPNHTYEAVNCGGLSYASYRLRQMLGEILSYEPDLIVLATGHNEFLEDRSYQSIKNRGGAFSWFKEKAYSLRTVTLARQLFGKKSGPKMESEVAARLDKQSGYASYHRDDAWREGVIKHFDVSVRAIIKQCREAGVPIVLVNLGSNLRDCPPFKSENRPGLSEAKRRQWETKFSLAEQLETRDVEEALARYQDAAKIDDEHALLNYRIARCLDRLGRNKEAGDYYVRAKDWDVCPLRMLETMYDELGTIGKDTEVPYLDARALLSKESPDGIPGNDLYVDHVHPTIRAHQRIAEALVKLVRNEKIVETQSVWSDRQRQQAYSDHLAGLGPSYVKGGQQRVGWLENWARRARLYNETLPVDTRGELRQLSKRIGFGDDQTWYMFPKILKSDEEAEGIVMTMAFEMFREGRSSAALNTIDTITASYGDEVTPAEVAAARLILLADLGREEEQTALSKQRGADIAKLPADNRWRPYLSDELIKE